MNKEFIPYKESLAMKELGFDERILIEYDSAERGTYLAYGRMDDARFDYQIKLSYAQAFRWFREKHGLFYLPNITKDSNGDWWWFSIEGVPSKTVIVSGSFIYEEVKLQCLRKLIELVKSK